MRILPRSLVAIAVVFVFTCPCVVEAQPSQRDAVTLTDFTKHVTPAPVARHRGAAAARDQNGNPVVVLWLSTLSDASLLRVDVNTGETEQFRLRTRVRGRGFLLTDTGHFYAYGDSKLLVYDINENTLDVIEGPGRFGYGIAEADDGTVYVALNPNGHLLAYDPRTQELTEVARVRTGDQMEYPRQLAVDSTGWVYVGMVQSETTVGVYPPTGETRVLAEQGLASLPGEAGRADATRLYRAQDGAVYARTSQNWLRFYRGEVEALTGEPEAAKEPSRRGNHGTVHRDFGDDLRLRTLDVSALEPYLEVEDEAGEIRRVEFNYESDGTRIQSFTQGPDGNIYGATHGPPYIFRYEPETDHLRVERMEPGPLRGTAMNEMVFQGGYLFGALYNHGELIQIDPDSPWAPEAENPRLLARARTPEGMITRPYMLVAHPDGQRVVMGGYYDRTGVTGGGLVIHDMVAEETIMLNADDLLQGHSPNTACVLPDGNLLVGTTVGTRGRAERTAEHAALFILDMQTYSITDTITLDPAVDAIRNLVHRPEDEMIFGLGDDGLLFAYDTRHGNIVHHTDLERFSALFIGPDGGLYIFLGDGIARVDPDSLEHQKVPAEPFPVDMSSGFVVREDRVFFRGAHQTELWSARLSSPPP